MRELTTANGYPVHRKSDTLLGWAAFGGLLLATTVGTLLGLAVFLP